MNRLLNVSQAKKRPVKNLAVKVILLLIPICLPACQSPSTGMTSGRTAVLEEMQQALESEAGVAISSENVVSEPPREILDALIPELAISSSTMEPVEEKFDFAVQNQMPAREFFSLLTEGTDYSIVVHPDVQGSISALDLKNVTVAEALEQVAQIYGYVVKKSRDIYQVFPGGLQTRIFKIDYLNVTRNGTSNIQITSSSIGANNGGGSGGGFGNQGFNNNVGGLNNFNNQGFNNFNNNGMNNFNNNQGVGGNAGGAGGGASINTTTEVDYWEGLEDVLLSIINGGQNRGEGGLLGLDSGSNQRSVIVSPHTGMVVVRAYPDELAQVEAFLETSQAVLQRQVVLEAKILEVELKEEFQAGIDLNTLGDLANGVNGDGTFATSDNRIAMELKYNEVQSSGIGSPMALNFRFTDFAGMIRLLETQGDVQVISSPRISTLNNQKAVFKVGDEQFFLTGANTTSFGAGDQATTNANAQLQPFFSGIALDVLPQISDAGDIILHIHPILSSVQEDIKVIRGEEFPLANSITRESDSIARARNGEVVVISGLMQTKSRGQSASVPGASDIPVLGNAFTQKQKEFVKTELVILLRAVVDEEDVMRSMIDEHAQNFEDIRKRLDHYYR